MNKTDSAKIDALLAKLWSTNLPTLRERLDLLDRTAATAASGSLDETARTEALNIAHKLAGSLGMFGYQEGTEIARQIEQLLKAPTPAELTRLSTLTNHLRDTLAAAIT
jgi:HPt (histidine-containing phosphotransfer) domain-containing protein